MEKKNLIETKVFVFEELVAELSRKKPDRRRVVDSCKFLGLPVDLEHTDLMQLLLEKYPDFLSLNSSSDRARSGKRPQSKSAPLNS